MIDIDAVCVQPEVVTIEIQRKMDEERLRFLCATFREEAPEPYGTMLSGLEPTDGWMRTFDEQLTKDKTLDTMTRYALVIVANNKWLDLKSTEIKET